MKKIALSLCIITIIGMSSCNKETETSVLEDESVEVLTEITESESEETIKPEIDLGDSLENASASEQSEIKIDAPKDIVESLEDIPEFEDPMIKDFIVEYKEFYDKMVEASKDQDANKIQKITTEAATLAEKYESLKDISASDKEKLTSYITKLAQNASNL